MLDALAGRDPRDPSSSDAPVPGYTAALAAEPSPPRVGVVRRLFFERADSDVVQNVEAAIAGLRDAGAYVEDVTLPVDFEAVLAAHRVIMAAEAAAVHEADFRSRPEDYGPKLSSLIEEGLAAGAVPYVQAQRVLRESRSVTEEGMRGFDVLLTPSTPSPAPRDLGTTGDPAFQTPWTAFGFPALTLPTGLSASGLPLGIQLASAPLTEAKLLAAALWCERVVGVALVPPIGR